MVGFCGLKPGAPDTPIAGEIEAGWVIASAHWRQGYALEAMGAIIEHGWTSTPSSRIVAITARRNARSRMMMERLGMTHVGALDFLHPQFSADDPLADVVTYILPRP